MIAWRSAVRLRSTVVHRTQITAPAGPGLPRARDNPQLRWCRRIRDSTNGKSGPGLMSRHGKGDTSLTRASGAQRPSHLWVADERKGRRSFIKDLHARPGRFTPPCPTSPRPPLAPIHARSPPSLQLPPLPLSPTTRHPDLKRRSSAPRPSSRRRPPYHIDEPPPLLPRPPARRLSSSCRPRRPALWRPASAHRRSRRPLRLPACPEPAPARYQRRQHGITW